MRKRIIAGWREKVLWAGAIVSCAGVIASAAGQATAREFTISVLAAFCLTTSALQVSWVSKRMDRLYRAEMTAMKRQLVRVTGPQLELVEPTRDRTRPSRAGNS